MTSWFLLFLLCCTIVFNNVAVVEARLRKNISSAVVVGAVFCDTCFHQDISSNARSISGASVEVLCKDQSSNRTFLRQVKTNDNGEFSVRLPFSVAKHVRRIRRCSVKLLSSNEPFCSIASTATSSSLKLKSRKQGTPIFSAGFFTFKPQNQPTFCNQKPSSLYADRFPPFPPPLQDPAESSYFLPPLPPLPPLPQLPPLPPLPGIPFFPPSTGTPATPALPPPVQNVPTIPPVKTLESESLSDKKAQPDFFRPLVPNPFQPPQIIPPIVQPPPLFPPLLPPNPLQPPPLLPLPPIPGLTPPPPPPVIPSLPPFGPLPPLPPFPFPPSTPRGPGVPPASTSHKASP